MQWLPSLRRSLAFYTSQQVQTILFRTSLPTIHFPGLCKFQGGYVVDARYVQTIQIFNSNLGESLHFKRTYSDSKLCFICTTQIRYLPHHPNVSRRLGRLNKKSMFPSLGILQECYVLLKKHNIQVSPVSSSWNHIQYLGRILL